MSLAVPDIFQDAHFKYKTISSIDMHTCGEPTRIVYKGYPPMSGQLQEQRSQAKSRHDHVRRQLMLEPRGHADMYGAILRSETELVATGDAHIGVLFMHNEGYSTACGHATIALGRFLLDTHDLSIFPKRNELKVDAATKTVQLNLHPPCGLVKVTVVSLLLTPRLCSQSSPRYLRP